MAAENLLTVTSSTCLKVKGLIFALVHLPTNSLYIAASLKSADRAIKQHWYGAHLRTSRFHKLLTKSKLKDYFFWPLETISSFSFDVKARKKFWIKQLLSSSKGQKEKTECPKSPRIDTIQLLSNSRGQDKIECPKTPPIDTRHLPGTSRSQEKTECQKTPPNDTRQLLGTSRGQEKTECSKTPPTDTRCESLGNEKQNCSIFSETHNGDKSSFRSISPHKSKLKVWRPKPLQKPIFSRRFDCTDQSEKQHIIKYHWHNLSNEHYRPTGDPNFKYRDELKYPHPDALNDDQEGYLSWVAHVSGIDSIEEYRAWYASVHEYYQQGAMVPYIPNADNFARLPPLPILDYPHPDIINQTLDKFGNGKDSTGNPLGWTDKDEEIWRIFLSFCCHVLNSHPGEDDNDILYAKWYNTIRPCIPTVQNILEWCTC